MPIIGINEGDEVQIFATENVLISKIHNLKELRQLLKDFDSPNGRENLLQFIDELKV